VPNINDHLLWDKNFLFAYFSAIMIKQLALTEITEVKSCLPGVFLLLGQPTAAQCNGIMTRKSDVINLQTTCIHLNELF